MRVAGLHHLALRTPNLEEAERFYAGVLGLEVIERFAHPDGTPRSVWVALPGGAFLALEVTPSGAPPADPPGWHCVALGIARADRSRWRRHLEAHGYPIERESDFTLYVRGPAGALIALSHHPDRL